MQQSKLSFGPGGKHVLEMVTHVLGSYTPNTDSDLVLLAHERSDLFKSITEVVLLQLQGLSSLCFSRDVTARRYRGKPRRHKTRRTLFHLHGMATMQIELCSPALIPALHTRQSQHYAPLSHGLDLVVREGHMFLCKCPHPPSLHQHSLHELYLFIYLFINLFFYLVFVSLLKPIAYLCVYLHDIVLYCIVLCITERQIEHYEQKQSP